jgi:hypothetical protein
MSNFKLRWLQFRDSEPLRASTRAKTPRPAHVITFNGQRSRKDCPGPCMQTGGSVRQRDGLHASPYRPFWWSERGIQQQARGVHRHVRVPEYLVGRAGLEPATRPL